MEGAPDRPRVPQRRGCRPVWYAKYRLPDGRHLEKCIGPPWTGRGRPPAGYVTRRPAEDWLRATLDVARRGVLPGTVRTGATFADAAAEYLRYAEQDRGRKPCIPEGQRSALNAHLLPAFGAMPVEHVTVRAIERWIASFDGSPRLKNKLLIELHGILRRARKVWGPHSNAAAEVEKFPQRESIGTLGANYYDWSFSFNSPLSITSSVKKTSGGSFSSPPPTSRSVPTSQRPSLRPGPTGLLPYVARKLARDTDGQPPIAEVIVGPGRHPKLAAKAAVRLLQREGYDDAEEMVKHPETPLRV
jgi:hypothetical protein